MKTVLLFILALTAQSNLYASDYDVFFGSPEALTELMTSFSGNCPREQTHSDRISEKLKRRRKNDIFELERLIKQIKTLSDILLERLENRSEERIDIEIEHLKKLIILKDISNECESLLKYLKMSDWMKPIERSSFTGFLVLREENKDSYLLTEYRADGHPSFSIEIEDLQREDFERRLLENKKSKKSKSLKYLKAHQRSKRLERKWRKRKEKRELEDHKQVAKEPLREVQKKKQAPKKKPQRLQRFWDKPEDYTIAQLKAIGWDPENPQQIKFVGDMPKDYAIPGLRDLDWGFKDI